jgi:peptide/nickel transport system substrate-binding protein
MEQADKPMPAEEVTASGETAGSKDLVVCMVGEPESLYLYGSGMYVTQNAQHAIYESLFTQRAYSYQAQGLAKLPSLADGDAAITVVEVRAGDRVVDASGQAVVLADGATLRTAAGEVVVFDGTPLMLAQMQVEFTFKPLVWSDGRPVTAADSVFSFHLAAETELLYTQVNKSGIERTATYEATGDLTVRWRGLPGWLDPHYFLNVWLPLPQHQLGHYTAAELLEVEEAARKPLAHGPFMVTGWTPGEAITLVRNPHYYRAAEGLPYLDSVTFRFIPDADRLATQVLADRCHIGIRDGIDVSQVPFWREAEASGLVAFHVQASPVFEHIDFGINPVDEYAATRPDWFEDARVRQAIALCNDRQGMVDTALLGASEVWPAYIPGVHPLYPADLTAWAYDDFSPLDLKGPCSAGALTWPYSPG